MFFRDRIRTSVNILGDGIGAGVVDHLVRSELGPLDTEETTGRVSLSKEPTGSELVAERRFTGRDETQATSKL